MSKEISKKAKIGLNWAANVVEENISFGINPELALVLAGIKGLNDTYFFMEYLRESGRKKLLEKLVKPKH